MVQETFAALVLTEDEGMVHASMRDLPLKALPDGDVLISVAYSSLNYKDGLAITGRRKVVRHYPMVPGIDLCGTVMESQSPLWQPGDQVILTGWGSGERHWGGYAQLARVKAEWLLPLPNGLDGRRAMALGTAGLAAMLSVLALEEGGTARDGPPVLVTGASGGVGSLAVALLAQLGYAVTASTRRLELRDYLMKLGARAVIGAIPGGEPSAKPLATEHWGGAVDTVGGITLAALLRAVRYGGRVVACGLAGGSSLSITIFPFILRGVSLIGIDSVYCPLDRRRIAWARLARSMSTEMLDEIAQVVPLREVPSLSRAILRGQVRGRIVVSLS
jgi:acrylyl-CoA reductase (NADPH)